MASYFPVGGALSGTAPNPSLSATAAPFFFTSSVTNTSYTGVANTFAVISGMTLTPLTAGNYLVMFEMICTNTAAGVNDNIAIQIFVNGVAQANTLRNVNYRSSTINGPAVIHAVVNYGGVGPITVQWSQTLAASTITAKGRSLFLMRLP